MLLIPLAYYHFGPTVSAFLHLSLPVILWIILAINIVFELLRLKCRWMLLGHREHERRYFSSFSWGVTAVVLVLLLAPGREIAIPIIWSCALVDPLLGESRRLFRSKILVATLGVVAVGMIWIICYAWLGTTWWFACIMAPITVAAEWPTIKGVDDNALMMLVPLIIMLILG